MENEQDHLCTYAFYDEKARRVSIFATVIDKRYLHIQVVTCSPKDHFKKQKAKLISKGREENGSSRGRSFIVDIEDNKPKWSFMQWCLKHYYKPQLVDLTYRTRVLMQGDEPLDKPYYIGSFDLVDVTKTNKQHADRKTV
jgi:hypothetical protein